MLFSSEVWTAKNATLGRFRLPASLVDKVGQGTPLPPDANAPMPGNIQGNVVRDDSGFYIGENPQNPMIGDMRIRFRVVEPTTVSVVATQQGDTFAPYQTKAGGTIELLKTGVHSSEEMFQQAQAANTMMTWILRVVGFVVMLIGLNLIMKPLSVFADVLPILGNIVGAGTFFIAFMAAAGFSMITIAIAWIAFRPLLAGGLIAGAAAIGFLVMRRSGRATAAA